MTIPPALPVKWLAMVQVVIGGTGGIIFFTFGNEEIDMNRILLSVFYAFLLSGMASRSRADDDQPKPSPDVPFPYTVKLKPGEKAVVPLELGTSRIKWTISRVAKGKLEPIESKSETSKIKDADGDEVERHHSVYTVSDDWKVVINHHGQGTTLEIQSGKNAKESEVGVVIREESTFYVGKKPPDRVATLRLRIEKVK